MNIVCGPCESSEIRLSPPWYLEAVVELLPLAEGSDDKLFSTSLLSSDGSIPVPKTATPPLVKVDEANDLTSSEVIDGPVGEAKRDEPRPFLKASA
jgi:hypothetical protein